jgi:hypothetical protein
MTEELSPKDFEIAETIARKLTELGLGWARVTYEASFRPVDKGIIRKKRKAERCYENLRVSVLPDAKSIEEYKEIRNKLRTIARSWKKEPSSEGKWLYLESKVGNVNVSVAISFPEDKIIPIMSELLKCQIEKHVETRPGYTVVFFACKTQQKP